MAMEAPNLIGHLAFFCMWPILEVKSDENTTSRLCVAAEVRLCGILVFVWRLQVYQGSGSEAPRPDRPTGGDGTGAAEKERLRGHHTADKGRREDQIGIN